MNKDLSINKAYRIGDVILPANKWKNTGIALATTKLFNEVSEEKNKTKSKAYLLTDTKSRQPDILISGGGTGGHIYPAIAIADELKKRYPKANILFVGAKGRMEMEKVPQAGYPITGLWISGIQRRLTLKNMVFPLKLLISLWKAFGMVRKLKPDVVIGTGGFASGPLVYAASKRRIPIVLQEQNSFPGITNKILARSAGKICVAYDGMERFFPKEKLAKTGNPVRQDLLDIDTKREEALSFFKLDKNRKTILVLGGSLGARAINTCIEREFDWMVKDKVQLLWQTGKYYYDDYQKYDTVKGVHTFAFLNRMDLAYAAADIIISRAGAASVSELCIVGKPVVFIPSPNVAEDHQTKNAMAVTEKGAALMLKEENLKELFKKKLKDLLNHDEKRKKLGEEIKKMALPDATKEIVNHIEKLLP